MPSGVFPAYAGVVPPPLAGVNAVRGLPRIRGGGPQYDYRSNLACGSSPHTRGWSLGCTIGHVLQIVFPAYAGVVRGKGPRGLQACGLPRIRGGGPSLDCAERQSEVVFPAYAGVVPHSTSATAASTSLPRIRGGGPQSGTTANNCPKSSPHTRGWFLGIDAHTIDSLVFPAYAGVVPAAARLRFRACGLPRMRGGGPSQPIRKPPRQKSSPHARGWSLEATDKKAQSLVFPACAGVVESKGY